MLSLNMTFRKLGYVILIFVLNDELTGVSCTPKDVLVGFIKGPPMVGIPYIMASSIDMTASICCDICYLNRTSYSVILDQSCTCTNNLLDNIIYQCDKEKPCPGDNTETCGCAGNNYAIVYSNGTSYTYIVEVMTSSSMDKTNPGFKGDVYFNIIGPDGRECREVAIMGYTCTVGLKSTMTVLCRDLKGFALMRLGHSNKKDGWAIEKVTVTDPTTKSVYSFSKCGVIYLGIETGNGTMAEFRANLSCGFPIKGDNYYSLEELTATTAIICSSGRSDAACASGGETASEYIAFGRYFHKHVFPLTGLVYIGKYDCDDISLDMPNVVRTGRKGSVIGSSYIFNCTNGYFVSSDQSRTRIIQPICQATGLWSVDSIPECIPACFGKVPGSSVNVSLSITNQSSAIAGDQIVYSCKNGVFDGFSDPCNKLDIVCLTSGNWSITTIPTCTLTSSFSSTTNDEVTCPNSGICTYF